MNLSNPNYYTTERAFQNYMHYGDENMISIAPIGGSWNGGPALTYDAVTGYPNNIGAGNEAVMGLVMNSCEPVGTSFTITWTGPSNGIFVDGSTSAGTNTLTWTKNVGQENFLVRFRSNSISNLVIRRTAEPITGLFRKEFLDRCKRYNTLRLMNWGAINEWDTNITTWSQRIPNTHRSKYSLVRGCPYETMIDLCNETQCNMWMNVPHVVNDAWITNLCNLIQSRRVGNWKVYLEWSNEVWNTFFVAQHNYAVANSANVNPWDWYEYVITKTQAIGTVARATGLKIDLVLNLQAHTTDHTWYLKDRVSPAPYNLDGINTLAIAPYFGGRAHLTTPTDYRGQLLAGGLTEVFNHLNWHIDNECVSSINSIKSVCAARGKNLVFYESGQHLLAAPDTDTPLVNLFISANRDGRMYDAYVKYLRLCHNMTPTLNCIFDSAREYSNKGTWGLVEYEGQSLTLAHKQRAWNDWLDETKQ